MTRRTTYIVFGLLVVILLGLPASRGLIHLLTESWWFDSVSFGSVFRKALVWEGVLGSIVLGLFIAVLGFHYWLSRKLTRDRPFRLFEYTELERYSELIVHSICVLGIGFIALAAAVSTANAWTTVLQFIHAQTVNDTDPVFFKDIGFYLFRLPFWDMSHQVIQMLSIWSLALTATIYSLKGIFLPRTSGLTKPIQAHLTLVIAAVIALIGWGFWLDRYHLLTQSSGRVYGIGYTDANARLLGLNLMCIITVLIVAVLLSALRTFRQRLFLIAIFLYGTGWIGLLGVYPWMVQQFIVKPNELVKEKPYLAFNIQGTQKAYQLNSIKSQDYEGTAKLSAEDLASNQATLQNVRLWDYMPLLQTYRQLQEIRSYYSFKDVDVDRYRIQDKIQQVMLSARELATNQLPSQAQNWINQQLKYTHGHGLVMSPVNRVTSDGLPNLFIKDIPPKSSVGLEVEQPSIYYGELTQSYIFTGTTTDEFDYPQGGKNAFVRYSGPGGVSMGSLGRKLAYSLDFRNFRILISNYFGPETKVHYYRTIRERARHIAPFLRYDQDPYLVLADKRLFWIIDAYTVSDRYPYSEPSAASLPNQSLSPSRLTSGQINYIRNSVKVVVDAYTGDLTFYVVDPNDPIIQTYRSIFPSLFTADTDISPELRSHFRYPEDLFKIQTNQYLKYHMTDPEVYYNREDLWEIPEQIYEGQKILVEPYYIIMRLPEEETSEFVLIQPFTPHNKRNMIAWMAARSDGNNYGSLIEYNFPKQTLVYGPSQIEARIDQEPKISEQITLWSQSGSKVIRGNLITLPINGSLLYVEPIYLRAETEALPQLEKIVVVYDKSVVMADTFDGALQQIFGTQSAQQEQEAGSVLTSAPSKPFVQLAQEALNTHTEAESAARNGDWAKFGQLQEKLKTTLQKLTQQKSDVNQQ